jgi:hypothetical protein
VVASDATEPSEEGAAAFRLRPLVLPVILLGGQWVPLNCGNGKADAVVVNCCLDSS